MFIALVVGGRYVAWWIVSVKRVANDRTARNEGALNPLKHRNRVFDSVSKRPMFLGAIGTRNEKTLLRSHGR